MRFPLLTQALAALCLTVPVAAQKVTATGASTMRAETRIVAFTEDFTKFAMASLTYGQPEWKAEYDAQIDSLKGKTNRLGKDWFTTLITSSELELGGVKIAPGSYIVGVHVDAEGKFALALMDSTKAMQQKVNPFTDWKPEITVPVTMGKGNAPESVQKMTMTFEAKPTDEGGKGTLTIAWGKHALSCPAMLYFPK
jgi:hypothetical protein